MAEAGARIVVGYDGSPSAEAALRWSVDEAARWDSDRPAPELQVVIAATAIDPVLGIPRRAKDAALERWLTAATDLVDAAGVAGSRIDIVPGRAVDQLLAASHDAALLAVGSGDHSAAPGSLAQHLARHADCPVVVLRPPARTPLSRRIVVGVDGSPESCRALDFACRHARRRGETVSAIYGFWSPVDHVLTFDLAQSDLADRHQREAEQLVAEACAAARSAYPDVDVEPEAIPVRPGPVLVDASAAASLVVVGSRGRGAFTGLLLGSVSQHVLHHALCDVAVVR